MEWLDSDDFYSALTAKVVGGERPVTFLVGSALSLPDDRELRLGVPGVSGMLDLVRDELRRVGKEKEISPLTSYQEAFRQLKNILGPEAPNRVIQRAVLMSRWQKPNAVDFNEFWKLSQSTDYQISLERCSQTSNGWHVSNATKSVARLCSLYPTIFGGTVLTTNFDPLLEIAIADLEMPYFSSALHADGSFGNVSGTGTHVVHLHGYWLRSNTLHTDSQLTDNRSQVRSSIRRLIEKTTVVVLGYGGWKDMFMSAIREIADDKDAMPDILWCFYARDRDEITHAQQHVLESLARAQDNARLFAGIDVGRVLPELVRRCQQRKIAERRSIVLNHFRRALWNYLFDSGSSSSPGDVAKELCKVAGEYLTVRATFASVDAARGQGAQLSPKVERVFEDFRTHLPNHDIKLAEYNSLEARRIEAVEFSEQGTDIDRAAMNAVLAADCYLVVGQLDGQTAQVFCAKALHLLWRNMDSDRYAFWLQVIQQISVTIDD